MVLGHVLPQAKAFLQSTEEQLKLCLVCYKEDVMSVMTVFLNNCCKHHCDIGKNKDENSSVHKHRN